MQYFIWGCAAYLFAAVSLMLFVTVNAVEGYEDENGFSLGSPTRNDDHRGPALSSASPVEERRMAPPDPVEVSTESGGRKLYDVATK
jgi:hypothetical protein